jgi:phosphoribosylformylglycinamidine synthase
VTVHPKNRESFERTLTGQDFAKVGRVREDDGFDIIGLDGETIIQTRIATLKQAWQKPLLQNR